MVNAHAGSWNASLQAWAYNYEGPLFAYRTGTFTAANLRYTEWIRTAPVSEADLMSYGATAISRCAPTSPHASLSQALLELRRDGIPAIPGLRSFQSRYKKATDRYKPTSRERVGKSRVNTGSEYLNVEFGWKPLLSDVRKLASSQRRAEKLTSDYIRDSGRLVRRRYEYPTTVTVTELDLADAYVPPGLPLTYWAVSKGKVHRTTTVTRRIWFEGAFTYHVSGGDDMLSKMRQGLQVANHLSGIGITPGVLYDLTPWSWAVDWFVNTGDVLKNISMMLADGLVVVYGYIMAETTTVVVYTNKGARLKTSTVPFNLTQTFTETVKQRRRATPFGFGLNPGEFTPRQLAIVAALGLSRDGRKLAL
nr:MAG: hypothetical protein 1 [Leviviridae sp.]